MAKELVYMPECHSTNDEAHKFIHDGKAREGLAIVTDNQTAGRGQRGNQWVTEAGKNLTFSLVLQPSFLTLLEQMYMTMCISLGLHDWLSEQRIQPVRIKWPNDVMVGNKKICGILIENHVAGQCITYCVVGVGLNIHQEAFAHPRATSVILSGGTRIDLPVAFGEVVGCIEYRYLQLRNGDKAQLKSDYLERLYRMGERRTFITGGKVFHGVIQGVTAEGHLEVLTPGGLRTFGFKEIEFGE